MFIVNLHYKKPIEIIEQFITEHRAYLDIGYQHNYLIASGPKNPRTGGILLSQLKDRETLENFLKNDPFILNEVASYELIEFTPVKHHRDFGSYV